MERMFREMSRFRAITILILLITPILVIRETNLIEFTGYFDQSFWMLFIYAIMSVYFIKITLQNVNFISVYKDFRRNLRIGHIVKIVITNALLSISLVLILSYVIYQFSPELLVQLINKTITGAKHSKHEVIFTAIAASFLAPVVEEYIFRGIILNKLKDRFGITVAIVISSLIFGSLHYQLAILGATTAGISFALLYVRTNNILNSIFAHFLNNFLVTLPQVIGIMIYGSVSTNTINITASNVKTNAISGVVLFIITAFFYYRLNLKNWPQDELKVGKTKEVFDSI